MDDVDDGVDGAAARSNRPQKSEKYMAQLQEVADRKREHITIELDDLREVRCAWPSQRSSLTDISNSLNKI